MSTEERVVALEAAVTKFTGALTDTVETLKQPIGTLNPLVNSFRGLTEAEHETTRVVRDLANVAAAFGWAAGWVATTVPQASEEVWVLFGVAVMIAGPVVAAIAYGGLDGTAGAGAELTCGQSSGSVQVFPYAPAQGFRDRWRTVHQGRSPRVLLAFAVWNGSNQKVGARKQLSRFYNLRIQGQECILGIPRDYSPVGLGGTSAPRGRLGYPDPPSKIGNAPI